MSLRLIRLYLLMFGCIPYQCIAIVIHTICLSFGKGRWGEKGVIGEYFLLFTYICNRFSDFAFQFSPSSICFRFFLTQSLLSLSSLNPLNFG